MNFWNHPLIKNIGPEQFRHLFKTTPVSAVAIIVNATLMALALLIDINWLEVAIWWSTNILCAGYALFRWSKNKHPAKHSNLNRPVSKRAILKLNITAFFFAMPWAWLMLRYLGEVSRGTELVLVLVVATMAATGSTQLSRIYPAAMTFLTILLGAGIAKSLYLATPGYLLFGILVFSFGFFLKQVIYSSALLSIGSSKAQRALQGQIAELDRTKADLEKFAMEDPLTALSNRREFHNRLVAEISAAKRQGTAVSLLICDLDHFKNINDVSGHAAGDALLVSIAQRLQGTVRDHDIVARVGGDEFAIIAKNHQSPKDTVELAQRLLDVINQPVDIGGKNVTPGMSIGISMFPYDAQDDKTILSHADRALQQSKSAGRGSYQFFDLKLKSQLTTDQALEVDLRLALVEDEFELFYQPKVSIRTGQIVGFEALLRWRHSDGTLTAPSEFLHVAEDRGLISYLSDFVVKRALKNFGFWQQQSLNPGKLSINIHPVQIKDKHQMERLVSAVKAAGIDPGDIFLEITEGCIIGRGTENIPATLENLRKQGFRISLDDFGTGYASLSHLKDLPVDELKFDREFLSDLMENAPTRAIIHAMVKLANSLGISTVAEGVETREQHNVLMAIGCNTGQGFLYNRPMDFEAATKLLIQSKSNTPEPMSANSPAKSVKPENSAKSA